MAEINNIYSLCDQISSKQVMATAKIRLGLDSSDFDLDFDIEIDNAMKKFKSISSVPIINTLTKIENRMIVIPRGTRQVLGVKLSKGVPDITNQNGSPTIFYSNVAGKEYKISGFSSIESIFKIQNGYLVYRQGEIEDQDIILKTQGFEYAEDGGILLYDVYESPLAWYLCYLFLLKNPEHFGQLSELRKNEYYQLYLAEKGSVKAVEQKTHWQMSKGRMNNAINTLRVNDYLYGWEIRPGF